VKERLDVNFYINTVDFSGISYETKSLRSLSNDIFQGVTIRIGLPSDPIALKVKNILGDDSIDFLNVEHTCNVPEQKLLQAGDIITPFIGEAVRLIKFSVFNGEPNKYTIDGNVGVIRLNTNIVIPEYIQQWLQSRWGTSQILRLIGGGGVPFLGTHNAKKLLVAVPPYSIQQKLVADMQAARESRRRKLKEADELLNGIDAYLLETLGLTPPPAETKKVFAVRMGQIQGSRMDVHFFLPKFIETERIIQSFKGLTVPLKEVLSANPVNGIDARNYEDTGRPYLRVQNIRPYEIDTSEIKYVNIVTDKDITLSRGDILLTRKGSFGIAAVVTDDFTDCLISSEIILLRLSKASLYIAEYIVAWLNSSISNILMDKFKAGGIMGHLTQEVVNNFPLPVPSMETQRLIAAEIKRRREEARRLRAEAEAEWSAAKERFEESLLRRDSGGENEL
jgi:restriction endonuclease S subunit